MEEKMMKKYVCPVCGYVHEGEMPEGFKCPLCKVPGEKFKVVEGQMALGQMDPIMVSLDQFYGIEIDDFAVSVAKTALWIAQLQMTLETSEVMGEWIAPLPLKSNENIVCGNALRIDWNDVLPAEKCDYIIGNPPFLGSSIRSKEQTADLEKVFVNEKK